MTIIDLLPATSTWISWLPLVDAVAKATIILAAAGLATVLLRRASAASRHLVWTAALLGALALPVLSVALPRWPLPIVTLVADRPAEDRPAEAGLYVDARTRDEASQQMAASLQARAVERSSETTSAPASDPQGTL